MGIIFWIYILMSVAGLVLFKLGAAAVPIEFSLKGGSISLSIGWVSILGLFCYVSSFLLYMYLLTKNTLGTLVPLASAISYLLIMLAALVIFKEELAVPHIVGSACILVGVYLINYHSV